MNKVKEAEPVRPCEDGCNGCEDCESVRDKAPWWLYDPDKDVRPKYPMGMMILVPILLLTACGGGGSGPSEPQAQAIALPLIALYGDSVQRGDAAGGINVATEAQSLLPDMLLQQHGVNGSYAESLLDGPPKWSEVLKSSPAKVVSFNYGINDFYSLEDYRGYLTRLIQEAQAAGKVVILQTPNAITLPMQGGDMALRAQVGREVAAATGAVLCDQYANGLAKGMLAETSDGVHPNAAQLRVMGALFAQCVRRAV